MTEPIVNNEVGLFSYCGPGASVRRFNNTAGRLVIGKFCSIADRLQVFLGGNHRTDWATTYPFGKVYTEVEALGPFPDVTDSQPTNGDVIIGNDVWIGSNVTIMSGVHIGDGAVVGANSHVTRDVEPYWIVGGNPAELIRPRFDNAEVVARLRDLQWWNLPIETIKRIAPELCKPPTVESLDALMGTL